MNALFSMLALVWVAAATLAVWSSCTRILRRRRLVLTISWILTCLLLGYVELFVWALRDGLGPDSITTSGTVALKRFGRAAWFPAAVILAVPVVCAVVSRIPAHEKKA